MQALDGAGPSVLGRALGRRPATRANCRVLTPATGHCHCPSQSPGDAAEGPPCWVLGASVLPPAPPPAGTAVTRPFPNLLLALCTPPPRTTTCPPTRAHALPRVASHHFSAPKPYSLVSSGEKPQVLGVAHGTPFLRSHFSAVPFFSCMVHGLLLPGQACRPRLLPPLPVAAPLPRPQGASPDPRWIFFFFKSRCTHVFERQS